MVQVLTSGFVPVARQWEQATPVLCCSTISRNVETEGHGELNGRRHRLSQMTPGIILSVVRVSEFVHIRSACLYDRIARIFIYLAMQNCTT